jgi:hypothetical protein
MTPLCVIGETVVRQSRDDVVAVYLGGSDMNVRVTNKGDNTGTIWVCAEHAFHEPARLVVIYDDPRLNNRETQDDKPKKVRRHG